MMAPVLIVFGCLSGLELLIWLPPFWKFRKAVGLILLIAFGVASSGLLVLDLQVWTVLLAIFSFYKLINLLRLVKDRTQPDYLYNTTLRTALWIMSLQAVDLTLVALSRHFRVDTVGCLYALASVQLAVAVVVFMVTLRNLRAIKPSQPTHAYVERDLPTLTVAIPARNETDDLEACLQSLVTSTYPKLEILVLDDCSQNKRTPEIIRSFAHAGVSFIAGTPPPDHWLAKNYAYQQLTDAASGQLIMFCGVDTRFEPGSLLAMVETLLEQKKIMLSFLPHNQTPIGRQLSQLLVQPARYAWELALPRPNNRPPVLSTCWLITSEALHGAGSFKAISRGHSPESYFAQAVQHKHNGYSFLQSNTNLGLTSVKRFDEQQATAIRTRYPQLHRKPELVGLLSLAEPALLLVPFILAVGSLLERVWPLAALSIASSLLLVISFTKIVALTYRHFLVRGLWLLPLAVLYDIGLLNYSMWQYEFREVIWKGRNICIPLMRVVASLPQTNLKT